MILEKIFNWLKNNWKKIIVLFGCIFLGIVFHFLFLITGGVEILSVISLFIYSIVCFFLIFKGFKKKFFIVLLITLFSQIFITFYNFPKCSSSSNTTPRYECSCLGLRKVSFGGVSQCIGSIDKCYIDSRKAERREVSCDNFPGKLIETRNEN